MTYAKSRPTLIHPTVLCDDLIMPRWSVHIVRSRYQHLGTVEAVTEKEAIEKVIKLFNIDPPDATASP